MPSKSLEFTEEETGILREVLRSYLSDLRMEMADTDRKDFRDGLAHRKEVLQGVLGKLDAG